MKASLAIAAALLAATTIAEQYRLKFPATVDILEDGSVTGFKTIKSGTMINVGGVEEKTDQQENCFITTEKILSIDSGLSIEYHLSQSRQYFPSPFTSAAQTNAMVKLEREIQKRIFSAAMSKDRIKIHDVNKLIVKDFKLRCRINNAIKDINDTNRQLSYGQIKKLDKYKSDLTRNIRIIDESNDERIRLWNED